MKLVDTAVITVDVEDWYHVCGVGTHAIIPQKMWRVKKNILKILSLLEHYHCRATFFMLGSVAETEPDLAPIIARRGHEIASHGYSHTLLTDLSPQQFRAELLQTEQILISQVGKRPVGFRAPQWSVPRDATWMDDILTECGYLYDSSRNPLPIVGNPAQPLHPYLIKASHGALLEIPPMVTPTICGNFPTGGGWGFRFFPETMITATIRKYQGMHMPAVLYVHPREVDPEGPRLRLSPLKQFVSYGTRKDASPRLSALLGQFNFMTLSEVASSWQSAS